MSDAEPIKGEVQDMGSASGSGSPDEMLDDAHDVHEHDGSLETPPPPPKRKGGRKPVCSSSLICTSPPCCLVLRIPFQIYATSEERKQRNRQAQAAFRERRTEYIKQLEITLKQNEETIQNLRRSNRSATEECHLLRYRNSLLERIMIEKGKASNMSLTADYNMLTNTQASMCRPKCSCVAPAPQQLALSMLHQPHLTHRSPSKPC